MHEVRTGRVDIADYHETESDIDSSCEEENYKEVENDDHCSVCERLS